jgi:hypothetical protein
MALRYVDSTDDEIVLSYGQISSALAVPLAIS